MGARLAARKARDPPASVPHEPDLRSHVFAARLPMEPVSSLVLFSFGFYLVQGTEPGALRGHSTCLFFFNFNF